MGGVKLTTGLYDENFFGNPARVVANPEFRFTFLDPMIETSKTTISNVGDIASSNGNTLSSIGGTAGKNNHGRIQFTAPSIYFPKRDKKWSLAVGLITSAQFDVALRNSYQLSPLAIVDAGPAITFGRTFFDDESLAIGITPHLTTRIATNANFTLSDLISGKSLSPGSTGGAGTHIDTDIGATYKLPFTWNEFGFDAAFAVNNILGGNYSNFKSLKIGNTPNPPPAQPRTFGLGMAARRDSWGALTNTTLAIELQDIGNNPHGSLFRLIHIGGETKWRRLSLRTGLNQGYVAAGLGLDIWVINLDLSTYGEELSLNAGGLEDRRYAFKLAFQI